MAPCVINDQWSCRIQNSSYDSDWVEVSGIGIHTFGDQFPAARSSLTSLNPNIFRQLSAERRAEPDCDPPRCVLQRGGGDRAAGDGRQRSEASHRRQNPRHPQKLCQQGEKYQPQKTFWLLSYNLLSVLLTIISILFCRNTSQAVAPTPRGWMGLGTTGTCRYSRPTPPPPTRRLTASPSLPADLPEDLPQVPWTDLIFVYWMVLLTVQANLNFFARTSRRACHLVICADCPRSSHQVLHIWSFITYAN